MNRTCTFLLCIATAQLASAQQYALDSLCWGLTGSGIAILEDTVHDRIFVGGDFVQVRDPRELENCVEFNATSGLVVRQSPNPEGAVRCALPDGAGGWYIGGDFSVVGGLPRARLAHILPDGTVAAWAPVVVGSVRTMLIKGDTLYFGGGLTTVNGAARTNLAAVRRSTGTNVAWTQATANDTVRCMALNSGRLYVGGDFTQVNGSARSRIASFTVSNHALTTWAPTVDDKVRCAVATASAVYIGGDLTTVNGTARGGAASLNPTGNFVLNWNPNTNGTVNCMALSGSSILLGGTFTQVNGSTRNRIAIVSAGTIASLSTWTKDLNGAVEGITVLNDVVYATGAFERVDAVFRHRLVALGLPGTAAPAIGDWRASVHGEAAWCIAAQGSGIFVGGAFSRCGLSRRSIAAYDQTTGLPLPWDPGVNGEVRSLAQGADGTLYAAGSFTSVGGVPRANMVALDPLTGAVLSWSGGATLGDVNAIVLSGDTLVACGTFAFLGGTPRLGLGALSRTTAAVLPWNLPVAPGDEPKKLLLRRDTLYVCGHITAVGGTGRNAVAAIRLSTGTVLPFVADCAAGSSAEQMALDGDRLWVGRVDGIWGGENILSWDLLVLNAYTGAILPRQPMEGNTLAVRGNKVFTGQAYLAARDAATGWLTGSSLGQSCGGTLLFSESGDLLCAGVADNIPSNKGFFRVRIDPSISIRVMLDGPFSTGTMTPTLNDLGLLPTTEPYTSLGYMHTGGGGGEVAGSTLNFPSSGIIDWIVVEYRDAVDPSIVVASASRLLYSNGRVERAGGISIPTFAPDPNGQYHVAVRHRNHLGVMTAQPVDFSTSPYIDLTAPGTAVFGTDSRKNNSGTLCLWAGDVNFDGAIKYTGAANDRDPILVSIGGTTPNSILSGVYNTADVNMDGLVKYTGNKNDRDQVLLSIGGTTPNSTRTDQLP